MNGRRRVLLGLAGAPVAWRAAFAQQPGRAYRLGWLGVGRAAIKEPYSLALVQRLAELGFVEGPNLSIIYRFHENKIDLMPSMAADLAKQNCDVLFSGGPEAQLTALKQAGGEVPILFMAVDFDPVAAGHIANLAHPGGRITGVTAIQGMLPGKRLELLKELLPRARKFAVLANDQTAGQLQVAEEAGKRIGAALHIVDLKHPPFNYEAAFAEMVHAKVDALMVLGSGLWVPARRLIPELALKSKLPSMFHHAQWTEAGGFLSYGFSFPEMYRRGAEMMAQILRGAKAADTPMEQPSRSELVINMRTAKALGIKIPKAFLVRADRLIE